MTIDDASAALSEIRSTLLVVGTRGPNGDHFMVANWGTQASFDPWRYVICVKKTAHTLEYLKGHKAFTISLLDGAHKKLVMEIMKSKGDGHKGEKSATDVPRLPESYAGFDCRLLKVEDVGGDHALVVADVVDGWKRGDGPALAVQDLKLSYAG